MERRGFLTLGIGIAVSGCLGWGEDRQTRVGEIGLVNNRTEAYTVEVVIERDTEEVFTDEYQLGTSQGSSKVTFDPPVQEVGRFVFRFRADNQWVSIYPEDYASVDEPCIGVRFELNQRDTTGYEILPSTEC